MKKFKKILSLMLSMIMVTFSGTNAFAGNIKVTNTNKVTSYIDSNKIIERCSFVDNGVNVLIERITLEDGSSIISINKDGEIEILKAINNYEMLYNSIILENARNGIKANRASVDVHGSNFYHRYLASVSYTISNKELKTYTSIFSAILLNGLGLPMAGANILANFLYNQATDNGRIYSAEVDQTTYEVFFSYDDVYYCHCYHNNITYYDSGDHYLGSESQTYEAVGG